MEEQREESEFLGDLDVDDANTDSVISDENLNREVEDGNTANSDSDEKLKADVGNLEDVVGSLSGEEKTLSSHDVDAITDGAREEEETITSAGNVENAICEVEDNGAASDAVEQHAEIFEKPQQSAADVAEDQADQGKESAKKSKDDDGFEDFYDPFYGSQKEEEPIDARLLEKENKLRSVKFQKAGYRDGIIAGKEAVAQEGYNVGYKESVLDGYKFGIVRGVSSALAFLPDELREKLIDEQETREKFRKLHDSVHALSTEVALKQFYGTLTTKQGEVKSGEERPGSGSGSGSGVNATTDLGSYAAELSSLLDNSPKLEVKLDI